MLQSLFVTYMYRTDITLRQIIDKQKMLNRLNFCCKFSFRLVFIIQFCWPYQLKFVEIRRIRIISYEGYPWGLNPMDICLKLYNFFNINLMWYESEYMWWYYANKERLTLRKKILDWFSPIIGLYTEKILKKYRKNNI